MHNPRNPPIKEDGFWGDVKGVVAADAAGAVVGAGQAWWINAAGSEATVGYGAYIVGMGLVASAAEGTREVIVKAGN